ncbi:hypothetical protein D3C87_1903950 [compost metagenome]
MSKISDGDPVTASQDQERMADRSRAADCAKPLSPTMLDWMRRIQEAGVTMANDEEARKAIAKRLF